MQIIVLIIESVAMKSCQEKAAAIDKVVRLLGYNDLKQQQRSAFYIWTRRFYCSSNPIWKEYDIQAYRRVLDSDLGHSCTCKDVFS